WLLTPIVSLRAQATRSTFNYLDGALQALEVSHTAPGYSATFGVLTADDMLMAVNWIHNATWQGRAKVDVCRPIEGTGATRCQQGVIGAPLEKRYRVIEGQVKRFITNSFAAEVFLSHDLEEKAWAVELPLYFIQDRTGGLSGGVVASY